MEEKDGCAFNGRRLRQLADFGFLVDMTKFVLERLAPVSLEKGRRPEDEATLQESDFTRAAVGGRTWAAKERRPDAAAVASLTASSVKRLRVQDIQEMNKCIKQVKSKAELALRIQPIREDRLGWGVFTDASYINAPGGRSQGAFAVISFDKSLISSGRGICNVLHWRSGKINESAPWTWRDGLDCHGLPRSSACENGS